jgi:hypothetical protein
MSSFHLEQRVHVLKVQLDATNAMAKRNRIAIVLLGIACLVAQVL